MSLAEQAERIRDYTDNVRDGKNAIAEAITAKGVDTLPDSTFDTLATNIGLIEGGGGIKPVFDTIFESPEQTSAAQTITIPVSPNINSKPYESYCAHYEYLGEKTPDSKAKILRIVEVFAIHNNTYFTLGGAGQTSVVGITTAGAVSGTIYGSRLTTSRFCGNEVRITVQPEASANLIPSGQWRYRVYKIADALTV